MDTNHVQPNLPESLIYSGAELVEWIKANPEKARNVLPSIGFSQCFYWNPVDVAFENIAP